MSDWLKGLKVGDEAAICHSSIMGAHYNFGPVERITATQIIVFGQRFRRSDGYEIGHGYRGSSLVEPTPELKAEIEQEKWRRDAIRKLSEVKWRAQSDETLRAVLDALSKA